jgi:hypothetical protein
LGGNFLRNKNNQGIRNGVLKKSTNDDSSNGGRVISDISKDGKARTKSKVSFNASVIDNEKSAKESAAHNIEEQIK